MRKFSWIAGTLFLCGSLSLTTCEKVNKELIVGKYEMRYQADLSLYDDGIYTHSCGDNTFIMNRSFETSTYYFGQEAAYLVFKEDGTWKNEGAMIYEYWGTWERTGDGRYDYAITVEGRVPREFCGICSMDDESITMYLGTWEFDASLGHMAGQAYIFNAYHKK